MNKVTNGCDSHALTQGLMSAEEALQQLINAAIPVLETETIDVTLSLNRVLAENCTSDIKVPPLDNSAMDGYAVASANTKEGNSSLRQSQRICAGDIGDTLENGTIARIFTGAPLPKNADAVLMQEDVTVKDDLICFNGRINKGENVRYAGEDITIGDKVLTSGLRLRAQELGLAASIGKANIKVFRKLKVGIFFTGDELTQPGETLAPGKIYNSNRATLHGVLNSIGCEIVDLGNIADTLEATKEALLLAASQSDLVITSGGISVGEEDHVRIALEEIGRLSMWRVAMKPGKPLAFGHIDKTPFIGLPGNPVSAFATFYLFAAPFIKKMQGMSKVEPDPIPVVAGFNHKGGPRLEYLRGRLSTNDQAQTVAEIYPHQGSGVLMSTSWADGFVIIPINTDVKQGQLIHYLPFKNLS